jgi:hypothetical protein
MSYRKLSAPDYPMALLGLGFEWPATRGAALNSLSNCSEGKRRELDLQSLFGLHVSDVHSCTHWLRPRNSLLPPHLDSYTTTRELLVSQDRRHLFVTPWIHRYKGAVPCTRIPYRQYHTDNCCKSKQKTDL